MKVRKGFVSNSSSSSYVVDIGVGFDQFLNTMKAEYSWSFFSLKEIQKFYQERLQWEVVERERNLSDIEDSPEHEEFFRRSAERAEKKIEGYQNILDKLVEGNDYVGSEQMITDLFWKKGILMP